MPQVSKFHLSLHPPKLTWTPSKLPCHDAGSFFWIPRPMVSVGVAAVKCFGSVDPGILSINIWNPQTWRWMVQLIFLVGGETAHLKNIFVKLDHHLREKQIKNNKHWKHHLFFFLFCVGWILRWTSHNQPHGGVIHLHSHTPIQASMVRLPVTALARLKRARRPEELAILSYDRRDV